MRRMHNLTKIRIYRIALLITYLPSLVFVYPFALLKKKNSGTLFFFLDRFAIGGAQRVYLDILKSVEHNQKQIYFTRLSPDSQLKSQFFSTPASEVKDVHLFCDNLLFRLFTVHFYSFYLNRHPGAKVLSSNSTFFYDMLPFLSSQITSIELFHNFGFNANGMEFFGLANHRHLTLRVCVDHATANNIRKQYAEYNVNKKFNERIIVIEPGVPVPVPPKKNFTPPLRVLYAGRGGPQKRVWILNEVVKRITNSQLPVKFVFAGTMTNELSSTTIEVADVVGPVGSQEKMYDLYTDANLLILTSSYEGFPMVIKEAMACGTVPLVTALDGNKTHLSDFENAILIHNITDEDKCAEEAVQHLQKLITDPALLLQLSDNAYQYARKHFSLDKFLQSYRQLLLNNDPRI